MLNYTRAPSTSVSLALTCGRSCVSVFRPDEQMFTDIDKLPDQITHIFPNFCYQTCLLKQHIFTAGIMFQSPVLLLIFHLSMLLLFVLLQVRPGHWLLAHITQGDVSSAVDLMGSKISLWNVMFAKRVKMIMKACFYHHIKWAVQYNLSMLTNFHRTVYFHLPWLNRGL